jgi:hypothetical protein
MRGIITDMQDCLFLGRWRGRFEWTGRRQDSQAIVLFNKDLELTHKAQIPLTSNDDQ